MKIKKPKFWDYKKPNFLSYLLLPLTIPLIVNNFLLNLKNNSKEDKIIKKICVGNIYVGGTAKTPISIKLWEILNNLNFKSATIKKSYIDQIDEQKILKEKTKLYCFKTRQKAINEAIKDSIDIVIFDDGLQDKSINYDFKFVCFNSVTWIGNGFLMPAGPLREKISSISKYDAVFLNGNGEDNNLLQLEIKKHNPNIKIFETCYNPTNLDEFDKNENYVIFSGIGNPESFKKTLIKNKFNIIKEFKFPDHYDYTFADINKIKSCAKSLNAKILTTEKDYMKLHNDIDIKFLKIDIAIRQEDELINLLKSII